ncbi:D-glycero-beta-D-manno-heptose 1-phosphate adenylyltransferase [Streptomyces sp. 8N706]|uniref:D-glycero-beta-D-manno-heptose 1-phosphate adenylyltransferase n=1 Tax=Streptomyces sp. 8N706 TaxID=3457416 RepID=UPI003FD109BD
MTARRPLVVVGDALLDQDIDGEATLLAPDAPAPVVDVTADRSRPVGAGLAAALAAAGGREVVLITALGGDRASEAVRTALGSRVRLVELPLSGSLPVKTRVRADGRALVRIDRGGGTPGRPGAAVRAVLQEAQAVLVADYGRGAAAAVRSYLAEAARRVPLVWDPHPLGGPPVPGVRLATPNAAEARRLVPSDTSGPLTDDGGSPSATGSRPHADGFRSGTGSPPGTTASPPGSRGGPAEDDSLRAHGIRGARLAERWRAAAVAVTLGARGAILTRAGTDAPMYIPAPHRAQGDPCGAGDCFAATAAAALADGGLPEEAVQLAVAEAAAFVAAGGAGNPALWESPDEDSDRDRRPHATRDAHALAESVRARGGTVVATGGCFDLLHAGHVGLLQNARRTGDCLIVCVNSDASVRRLKGPGRPITPVADRVRVLAGLGCVDAVAVFDEDTPEALLRQLRPDVWVKGGDYRVDALPEAAALREWGGQALVLPYLDGRSTTELARRAALSPTEPQAGP